MNQDKVGYFIQNSDIFVDIFRNSEPYLNHCDKTFIIAAK